MVSYVMSYWNKNCPRVVPLPHPRCRRKILQKSQLGCCQQRNAPASPNPRVLSVGSGNGRDPRPKMFTFCGTTILILSKLSRGDNICQPGKSTPETWQDSCSVCHDFGGPHPSLLSLGLTLTEKQLNSAFGGTHQSPGPVLAAVVSKVAVSTSPGARWLCARGRPQQMARKRPWSRQRGTAARSHRCLISKRGGGGSKDEKKR